jgi:3-hydroxyisobutyrate dehydrogenase-like beta-hydroxyacid dehydrogenase
MAEKIAYVGIGQMGAGMAERLTKMGHDVVGYDVSKASRDAAVARGISVASSLKEAITGRRIILSSLPNSKIVRAVWLDEGGILSLAESGALCIDLSTIDPDTMKDIAAACRARGLGVVDVPVSGGPIEAAAGKLVLLVGGSESDIARARPVLSALGDTELVTGDVGTAKIVKLVNNVMSMGNILVAAEAFALGTAAGVDPQTLFNVLSQSGGRSHHLVKRFPSALAGNFEPGFKMELGEKDVALAIDLGRSMDRPMPVASLVREMTMIAMATGYRGKDVVALLDMYQRMAVRKE